MVTKRGAYILKQIRYPQTDSNPANDHASAIIWDVRWSDDVMTDSVGGDYIIAKIEKKCQIGGTDSEKGMNSKINSDPAIQF